MSGVEGGGTADSTRDVSLHRAWLGKEMPCVTPVFDVNLLQSPWECLRLSFLFLSGFGCAARSGWEVESGALTADERQITAGSAGPGLVQEMSLADPWWKEPADITVRC